jgi:t-SNARE complex subunit (syntaxin)
MSAEDALVHSEAQRIAQQNMEAQQYAAANPEKFSKPSNEGTNYVDSQLKFDEHARDTKKKTLRVCVTLGVISAVLMAILYGICLPSIKIR